jgi:hypothetical protein
MDSEARKKSNCNAKGNVAELGATAWVALLIALLSDRTIGYKGEQRIGGESVSQSLLKDQAFSTFLGQNPHLSYGRKMGLRQSLFRPMARHRQQCHQATSERQAAVAPLSLIAGQFFRGPRP